MLEFLSFISYSHFFFVVKLAYTTILQRTHQQPSRDDMVQFYCEHHNLDHGDFCSENYNIAGTPNLNSNSNSNLKVAVNLYVFLLFFQRVEITKVPWIELYNNMSKGSKFQDSKIGPKKCQKNKKMPKKGPRKGQNKPGGARSSQEEPGGARRSREEP